MKYVVVASWEDAPHLTPEMQAKYISAIPEHQRAVRTKGLPHLGEGLVYPINENDIKIPDFPLPAHFKRCYGFDTGWNFNAAVWLAWDEQADNVYLYDVYKRQAAEPSINVAAIQSRGSWIPGVADAADVNRLDGKQWIEIYRQLGLNIEIPDKAVDTGIQQVWQRLSTGRLRVFASCVEWFEELRIYSRNKNGILPKQNDHLLDATRYAILSGLRRSLIMPGSIRPPMEFSDDWNNSLSWMGV